MAHECIIKHYDGKYRCMVCWREFYPVEQAEPQQPVDPASWSEALIPWWELMDEGVHEHE